MRSPMRQFEKNQLFQGKAPHVPDSEKHYKYQPQVDRKSMKMVDQLKNEGKYGNNAVDHMSKIDLDNRKKNTKQAYIIELKTEK